MQTVDSKYGPIRLMGSGFQMEHGGGHLDTLAPEAGADTDAVLAEIGYDEATIAGLRADGVV
jgi:crotonobetainyl-CoA:carnitine CoA-transferase CaiB-like acyl-CoA transferase